MIENGKIPLTSLEYMGSSGTDESGYWEHRTAKGTNVRWANLVDDVRRSEGVALVITPGWNAYRPYDAQLWAYRNMPPGIAAYPGTSSHGGTYRGKESMALDVQNWGQLGKDKFYRYARKHGFEPGVFENEPWHIIDWSPWVVPPTNLPIGEDMSNIRIIDSPSYRAANQRVIHNGSAAMTVPAGWLQNLILVGKADYVAYSSDNDLMTEVNLVWQLGGLDNDAAAKKTADLVKGIIK